MNSSTVQLTRIKFQWYDKQVEIDPEDENISAYFSVQLQSKIIGKVHIHPFLSQGKQLKQC